MVSERINWLIFVVSTLVLTGIVAKARTDTSKNQKIITLSLLLLGIVVFGSVAELTGFIQITSVLSFIVLGLIVTIEYILLTNNWIKKIPKILQLK